MTLVKLSFEKKKLWAALDFFFNGYIFATSCDEEKNTKYDYFHKLKVLLRLSPIKKQKLIPISNIYVTPKNDTEQQTLTLSKLTGSDTSCIHVKSVSLHWK